MTSKERISQACEECLTEMFKRVGKTYPDLEFTDQPDWFNRVEWTEEQEDDFHKWMVLKLRRDLGWIKKRAEYETNMFLLDWGWRIKT